jgi:hypothetical protein
MTVTYHSGERIQGLSTEGISSVTFEDDDFAGWTVQSRASVTDGVLFTPDSNYGNAHITHSFKTYAIGEPDKFVFNWDWKFSGLKLPFIGITSEASAGQASTSNAGGYGNPTEGNKKILLKNNDQTMSLNFRSWKTGGSNFNEDAVSSTATTTNGTMYYYQFIKDGYNISWKRYGSIADRTAQTNAQQTITTTWNAGSTTGGWTDTADLAYIVIGSYGNYQNVGFPNAGSNYTYDFKFYSGVTSVVTEVQRPTNVQEGSRFEETDTRKIYYKFDANAYHSEVWYETGTVPYAGGRGVFAGGNGSNVMDYITIATTGNATDFGDLSYSRGISANNPSNGTRGVYGASSSSTSLDYITISTLGNSTTFGNNTQARNWNCGLDDQTTRGVYGGGDLGATVSNVMDYITIATTGNATDFGDLSASRSASGCVSTTTRGVFTGGTTASANTNIIDYITISTTGNATNFGNCTTGNAGGGGVDNNTRGVFWLGYDGSAPYEIINYITIATTGNATDFGDLITSGYGSGAVDNKTRGVKASGSGAGDAMEYITIDTTGNATDFGDLTTSRFMTGGVD